MPPRDPHRQANGRVTRWLALGLVFLLVLSACTSGGDGAPASLDIGDIDEFGGDEVEELLAGGSDESDEPADVIEAPTAAATDVEPPAEDQPRERSPLADEIEFLGSTTDLPLLHEGSPIPVSIDLPTLGVAEAPVTDVGVEDNGDMEIPGASEVGWYRFGPSPGDMGSAVLAAHIAFNGVDGVFRDLTEMRPGDRFSVNFSDGSSREFIVFGLRQWSKLEIPLEELFARDGTPRLVLITCGGNFNRALDSYDDNVVVIAIPTDLGT